MARTLAWSIHTQVAADVSRRTLIPAKMAPTDAGGYSLSAKPTGPVEYWLGLSVI